MKKLRFGMAISALLLVIWTPSALAKTEWQVLKTLKLGQRPVDMIVSSDKSRIYILTDEGQLLIYGSNGQLKDTIAVGPGIDQIKEGPGKDTLFLLNRQSDVIQMARVSFIEQIDTSSAPMMGNADAAVSIVVFSDFQ